MNEHLSQDALSAILLGETPDNAAVAHLARCPACTHEIVAMRSALHGFRTSAHSWAAAQAAGPAPIRSRSARRTWFVVPAFAVPAFAAACLIAVVAWLAPHWRERDASERAAAEIADAALLSQVDLEVSRAVPGPMEPLTTLVTWRTDGQDEKTNEQR